MSDRETTNKRKLELSRELGMTRAVADRLLAPLWGGLTIDNPHEGLVWLDDARFVLEQYARCMALYAADEEGAAEKIRGIRRMLEGHTKS